MDTISLVQRVARSAEVASLQEGVDIRRYDVLVTSALGVAKRDGCIPECL
jgi:hypothetical protein